MPREYIITIIIMAFVVLALVLPAIVISGDISQDEERRAKKQGRDK